MVIQEIEYIYVELKVRRKSQICDATQKNHEGTTQNMIDTTTQNMIDTTT